MRELPIFRVKITQKFYLRTILKMIAIEALWLCARESCHPVFVIRCVDILYLVCLNVAEWPHVSVTVDVPVCSVLHVSVPASASLLLMLHFGPVYVCCVSSALKCEQRTGANRKRTL